MTASAVAALPSASDTFSPIGLKDAGLGFGEDSISVQCPPKPQLGMGLEALLLT